jgi:hypothetical protein
LPAVPPISWIYGLHGIQPTGYPDISGQLLLLHR